MIYKFAPGFQLRTKPQLAGEFLQSIEDKHNQLTPELVLKESRNPEAPIHDEFEWDDETAAHRWRLEQAGYIIRAVVAIVVGQDGKEKQVRAFVNIERGDGYRNITAVLESPDMRMQLVKKALEELRDWRERYAKYKELAHLTTVVDRNLRPFEEKILLNDPALLSSSRQAGQVTA